MLVPRVNYLFSDSKAYIIFHCDAKYLASGVGVGQCLRRQNFASPNAKDTNMLVAKNAKTPDANLKFASPNAKPKRKSVEYRLRWVPNAKFLCWHVHFMLFVSISFAFGSKHKRVFQWNMGLRIAKITSFRNLTQISFFLLLQCKGIFLGKESIANILPYTDKRLFVVHVG